MLSPDTATFAFSHSDAKSLIYLIDLNHRVTPGESDAGGAARDRLALELGNAPKSPLCPLLASETLWKRLQVPGLGRIHCFTGMGDGFVAGERIRALYSIYTCFLPPFLPFIMSSFTRSRAAPGDGELQFYRSHPCSWMQENSGTCNSCAAALGDGELELNHLGPGMAREDPSGAGGGSVKQDSGSSSSQTHPDVRRCVPCQGQPGPSTDPTHGGCSPWLRKAAAAPGCRSRADFASRLPDPGRAA